MKNAHWHFMRFPTDTFVRSNSAEAAEAADVLCHSDLRHWRALAWAASD